MSDELKPCPFCGSKPVVSIRFDFGSVKCINESCWVRPHVRRKDDATKIGATIAIEAWNRRPTATLIGE